MQCSLDALPLEYYKKVLLEYLPFADLVRVDNAMCAHHERQTYLSAIRNGEINDIVTLCRTAEAFHWIRKRGVFLTHVMCDGDVDVNVLGSFFRDDTAQAIRTIHLNQLPAKLMNACLSGIADARGEGALRSYERLKYRSGYRFTIQDLDLGSFVRAIPKALTAQFADSDGEDSDGEDADHVCDLQSLPLPTGLEYLRFSCCGEQCARIGRAFLQVATNIQELELAYGTECWYDFGYVSATNLRRLDLANCELIATGAADLQSLEIGALELAAPKLPVLLSPYTQLQTLILCLEDVNTELLLALAACGPRQLKELAVTTVSDADGIGIAALGARFHHLSRFGIYFGDPNYWAFPDDALMGPLSVLVRNQEHLVHLHVEGLLLSDAFVDSLPPSLRVLAISHAGYSKQAVARLAVRCIHLRWMVVDLGHNYKPRVETIPGYVDPHEAEWRALEKTFHVVDDSMVAFWEVIRPELRFAKRLKGVIGEWSSGDAWFQALKY
jgi:hypothetical protein